MLNYFGQLRIYSLIDFVVLLIAAQANVYQFAGVILMHIGFLAYLESKHSHSYRKSVPKYLWIFLTILGMALYGNYIFSILFVVCSILYTLKTKKYFAIFAPVMRALQYFFLIGGITGFHNYLPWIALLVIFVRNFAGDVRDVVKDTEEGMKTLPIVIGLKRDIKYIHLITMLMTTTIWWTFTEIPLYLLPIILISQILTYNLTAR
jgi:4-hydroxybenzoate polyprenyltransferase